MGPLSLLLRLPLLPVQGVIRLGEIIGAEAERQLRDPARIRRVLEDAQQQWAAGEITDEELASIQEQATRLLISYDMPAGDPAGDDRS
jgi:hypothetical protein